MPDEEITTSVIPGPLLFEKSLKALGVMMICCTLAVVIVFGINAWIQGRTTGVLQKTNNRQSQLTTYYRDKDNRAQLYMGKLENSCMSLRSQIKNTGAEPVASCPERPDFPVDPLQPTK